MGVVVLSDRTLRLRRSVRSAVHKSIVHFSHFKKLRLERDAVFNTRSSLQFWNNVCNGLVNVCTDHIFYLPSVSADYLSWRHSAVRWDTFVATWNVKLNFHIYATFVTLNWKIGAYCMCMYVYIGHIRVLRLQWFLNNILFHYLKCPVQLYKHLFCILK